MHLYEAGGMRHVFLRGHTSIRKRLVIHVGGFKLGLLMRQLIGVATPRGLQGRLSAVLAAILALTRTLWEPVPRHGRRGAARLIARAAHVPETVVVPIRMREVFTTGCQHYFVRFCRSDQRKAVCEANRERA